ncbi:hypothetical protein ACPA54_02190 [Uniformispora flossi]|uniref:hypothetical protein n=1 Tax=Uniformispora flossi TaxID=3390723 RepID=UPI003C2FE973
MPTSEAGEQCGDPARDGPRAANAGSADAAGAPDFAADSAALPTARAVTVRSPTTAAAR